MTTADEIFSAINEVQDPETGVGLVDMGLIYRAELLDNCIHVVMTLTTPTCPLAGAIQEGVECRLLRIAKQVNVELTYDPPWSTDKVSEAGRQQLGL